jgi:hypothetical protein
MRRWRLTPRPCREDDRADDRAPRPNSRKAYIATVGDMFGVQLVRIQVKSQVKSQGVKESRSQPRVNQESTKSQPRVNQGSTKSQPRVNQGSTKSQPRVNQESTKSQPRVNQESTKSQPSQLNVRCAPDRLEQIPNHSCSNHSFCHGCLGFDWCGGSG